MRKSVLIRLITVGVLVLFSGLRTSEAQVTVSMPALAGSPGDTVVLPVTLANVESTGTFDSWSFDVASSSTDIVFLGHDTAGTLSAAAGWTVLSNTTTTMRVGGFASSTNAIATSGVLVKLSFRIDAIAGGSIQLENFVLKKGLSTVVAHTPAVPQTGFSTSNRPVATNDTYSSVLEGGTLTVAAATGVLANDTDADGDALTASLVSDVSNGTLSLSSDGSFTYIHDGSETTSDSFTYTASDGAMTDQATVNITVTAVNDAPVFTSVMSDTSVEEGSVVTGSFTATDADGDVLSYALLSGPPGAQVHISTGAFTWTAAGSGVQSVVVSVTDGTATVSSSVVSITVLQLETLETTLSGLNAVVPNVSAGAGSVSVEYLEDSAELRLSGSFSGLTTTYASAQIYVGGLSDAGTAVLTLSGTIDSGGRSGSFSQALNTFILSSVTFPSGVTLSSFENSLEAGEVFVNVLTIGTLTGEIRGQLRLPENAAPASSAVTGPLSATVAGDPTSVLYSLGWSSVSDSDGGSVRAILVTASNASLSSVLAAQDASSILTVDKTVAEGASLFDTITGGSPGSINLGGTATVYYGIVATDGAALVNGTVFSLSLIRGEVTNTQEDDVIPETFVLRGNFPNPFNPTTSIQFDLPEAAEVEISVMDLLGRTMLQIPSQPFSAGVNQTVRIDATELTSGIYIYRVVARLLTETQVATGTMTLIK